MDNSTDNLTNTTTDMNYSNNTDGLGNNQVEIVDNGNHNTDDGNSSTILTIGHNDNSTLAEEEEALNNHTSTPSLPRPEIYQPSSNTDHLESTSNLGNDVYHPTSSSPPPKPIPPASLSITQQDRASRAVSSDVCIL